jgi:hypothetical protein
VKITQKQVLKMYAILILVSQDNGILYEDEKVDLHNFLDEIGDQQSEEIIELKECEND